MASSAAPFELIVVGGPNDGASVQITGSLTMGSGEYNSVRIEDPGVQPSHAKLDLTGDGSLWVTDLSGGSTLVDDAPVSQVELPNGSRLRVGATEFVVHQRSSGIRVRPSNVRVMPEPPKTVMRPTHDATALSPALADRPDDATLRPSDGVAKRRREAEAEARAMRPTVPAGEPAVADPNDATIMRSVVLPSQVIGNRYRILEKLASGGMGEVYKAEHTELGKIFALKVMKQELSQDPEFVSRFKREAVASSRIGQHNIVDISDFGRTEDGRFYFVMEYLDGRTLAEVINAEHALPVDRALKIGLQIGRALAAAHEQGIVHRDLKPENVVLVRRDGNPEFVKVLDFGVAKEIDGRGAGGGKTAVGMVVGTPQYMSPEQAAALPVDARSDIYSLGLIIHELLSGAPVFVGQTPSLLMIAHVTQPPRRVTSGLGLMLTEELENVVMAMLAKKPNQRPASMVEVVAILEEQLGRPMPMISTKTLPMRLTPGGGVPRAKAGPTDIIASRPSRPKVQTEPHQAAPEPLEAPGENSVDTSLDSAPGRSAAPMVVVALVLLAAVAGGVWFAFFGGGSGVTPAVPAVALPTAAAPPADQPTTKPAVEPKPDVAVAQPAPPPAVTSMKVKITSNPIGAEVFADNAKLGVTPLEFSRTKGERLQLKLTLPKYVEETRTVEVLGDIDLTVELKPAKRAAPPPAVRKPLRKPLPDDLKAAPF